MYGTGILQIDFQFIPYKFSYIYGKYIPFIYRLILNISKSMYFVSDRSLPSQ